MYAAVYVQMRKWSEAYAYLFLHEYQKGKAANIWQ